MIRDLEKIIHYYLKYYKRTCKRNENGRNFYVSTINIGAAFNYTKSSLFDSAQNSVCVESNTHFRLDSKIISSFLAR